MLHKLKIYALCNNRNILNNVLEKFFDGHDKIIIYYNNIISK